MKVAWEAPRRPPEALDALAPQLDELAALSRQGPAGRSGSSARPGPPRAGEPWQAAAVGARGAPQQAGGPRAGPDGRGLGGAAALGDPGRAPSGCAQTPVQRVRLPGAAHALRLARARARARHDLTRARRSGSLG